MTSRGPGTIKRMSAVVAVVLIALAAWYPPIQQTADAQVDAGLQRALVSYASARTLNALISVLQGTELSMQPMGVGVTLTLGQVLDPINDLVEQFSTLMLFASVSFGVQKALLAIGGNGVVSMLVSAAAICWAALHAWHKAPAWLTRLLVVLLMIRFAIPVVTIGSDFLYQRLFAADYETKQKSIEAVAGEIAAAAPQGPVAALQGPSAQPARSADASPAEPGAAARPASAADKGLLARMRETFAPAHSNAAAAADAASAPPDAIHKPWLERLKERFSSAVPHIDLNFDAVKRSLETLPERIIRVIVIFLLQTLIVPVLLLWLLYRAAVAALRPWGAASGT